MNLTDLKVSKIKSQSNDIAINVKTFGAKGDGITNDTQAFIKMFAYITAKYLTTCAKIVVPQGTYKITQDIVISQFENKTFEFIGNLLFTGCNAFEFKYLLNSRIIANRIEGNRFVYNGVDYSTLIYSGFKFTNCAYNNISIIESIGFKNGIWLYGVSGGYVSGTFYNTISFQNIYRCYNGILCSSDEITGWVNENTFSGGGIDAVNGIVQGDVINNGSGNFHNQKYYNIGFEQIRGGVSILFNEARSNIVLHPRFEGGGVPLYHIKEGNQAFRNKYTTSKYTLEISMISLNNNGGSEVEADLRISTSQVATNMKSVNGIIVYESNIYNTSVPNNTMVSEYNGVNLFSFKNSSGSKKTLGFYEEPIYIEDASMLNGFTNYTNTVGSAFSKMYYYRTGVNELIIGGYVKGGTMNTAIANLPASYRGKIIQHTFPVAMYTSSTVCTIGFIEVFPSGNIWMLSNLTGVIKICLDGIRIPLDY